MAEIEMQINQVQSNLDSLADSLGILIDHVTDLEQSVNTDDISVCSDERGGIIRAGDISNESDISWKLEDFKDGKIKASTYKTELEAMLGPIQNKVQQLLESENFRSELGNTSDGLTSVLEQAQACGSEKVLDGMFNLDAFTDIASCQTEIEALSRKWNLASLGSAIKVQSEDNGEQLEKFLKDVSAASDEQKPITSFGKYGKTCGKLNPKFPSKMLLSHDSSNVLQTTTNISDKLKNNSSHGQQPLPSSFAWHSSRPDTQMQSSSAVVSSNLRRTKTHGRGKGHVDVLDIESFKTDSDDELHD